MKIEKDRQNFDPIWYLTQYQDVAAAGVDPWFHYTQFGKAEGRLPSPNRALTLEHILWRGAHDVITPRLQCIISTCSVASSHCPAGRQTNDYQDWRDAEIISARWALARWHAHNKNWQAVLKTLVSDGEVIKSDFVGIPLLTFEASTRLLESEKLPSLPIGSIDQVLVALQTDFSKNSDTALAMANAVFLFGRLRNGRLDPADLPQSFARFQELMGVESSVLAGNSVGYLGNTQFVDGDELRLTLINSVLNKAQLLGVSRRVVDQPLTIDNLISAVSDTALLGPQLGTLFLSARPLVSVIIPMHNAGQGIKTALLSLFEQTWRPLEIIVVDDSSTDNSATAVIELRALCPDGVNLYLVRSESNRGAYAARNLGLAYATGELVTVHDSDDWSHPQKIEKQTLCLLEDVHLMGCFSHWVRASQDLVFTHWRIEPEGWTYRNMSSLMCRRSVFDALGSWDEVRVNGDTEFHERLLKVFGAQAVADVLPGVPLSFGRMAPDSLSQNSETHLITQYRGVRHDYMASARRWHEAMVTDSADYEESDFSPVAGTVVIAPFGPVSKALYLPPNPEFRPFPAPAAICAVERPVRFEHPLDEIQSSGLFDAGWYIRNHIDLQTEIIDPLTHYWEVGALEGRDPGPNFSTSGYLALHPEVSSSANPLFHFVGRLKREYGVSGKFEGGPAKGLATDLVKGETKGSTTGLTTGLTTELTKGTSSELCGGLPQAVSDRQWSEMLSIALPVFRGKRRRKPSRSTILIVGHAAGDTLYGAERSLIDVVKAIDQLGLNSFVVLPSALNRDYIEALCEMSLGVSVIPYGWWQRGKVAEAVTVEYFSNVIKKYRVDLIHVNTLVLDEPLVAARALGIPSLVHVRELPEHDKALRKDLNASALQLRQRLLAVADGVIVNSKQVLDWLFQTVDAVEGDSLIDDRSSATQSFTTQSDPADWLDDLEMTASLMEPDLDETLKAQPSAEDDASVVFEVDSKPVFLVPNTVDMSRLLKLSARKKRVAQVLAKGSSTKTGLADAQIHGVDQLVVGMLSSNLPKKGLADVLEIVRHLESMDSQVIFLLFGPQTSALQAVLDGQSADSGVRIYSAGYVDVPAKALKQVDVVINVSRFQESFGRTVLEAMAASRVVVGYEWGALPELVVNEETGLLVPIGDTQAIAERLVRLAKDPDLRARMGRAGRQRAVACFSGERLQQNLAKVYEAYLGSWR